MYERKRKDCARSWTFQPKSWHLLAVLMFAESPNQSPLLTMVPVVLAEKIRKLNTSYWTVSHIIRADIVRVAMSKMSKVREYYMLNHRIRDLLFHYKKGVILLQIYLESVLKKMHHLSFRARTNDVNSTK